MRGLSQGAVAALLLLHAAPAATPLGAQTPAEGALPSFRDMRRLEAGAGRPPAAAPGPQKPAATPAAAAAPGPAPSPDRPAPAAKAAPAAVAPPWLKSLAPGACGVPAITARALPAGRMQLQLVSACRAGEAVSWRYGGIERRTALDKEGRLELTVDCFAAASTPVEIKLADGTRAELPVEAEGLDAVTKVALVWSSPVDLDLHAFERAAFRGESGHVWAGAASSAADAIREAARGDRGAGFMGTTAAGGPGQQLEVYTYVHAGREGPGHIAFAVARKPAVLPAATPEPAKSDEGPPAGDPPQSGAGAKPPDGIAPGEVAPNPQPPNATPASATPPAAAAEPCAAALADVPVLLIVQAPGEKAVTTRAIVAASQCEPAGAGPPLRPGTPLLPVLRLGSR